MHRFFSPLKDIMGNKIIIDDRNQLHHLRDVLRLKTSDEVIIFDEKGNEYNCVIKKLQRARICLDIKERRKAFQKDKGIKVTVACAIPKKSRMDEIIDKLTQLGVDRIIPLETQRVIIKLDKTKKLLRHKRWKKIALNASLQSQRNTLPILEPIKNIEEVLSNSDEYDLKLIATVSGKLKSLKEIIAKSNSKNLLVFIGPEGDFTSEEIDLAIKAGCLPISLGDLVLRVETAAVAILSFIRLYEDS